MTAARPHRLRLLVRGHDAPRRGRPRAGAAAAPPDRRPALPPRSSTSARARRRPGAPSPSAARRKRPLFSEVAEESGAAERVRFANVRETGGWSNEADAAGPKMAALLAAAAEPVPPVPSSPWRARAWPSSTAATRPRSRPPGASPTGSTSRFCSTKPGDVTPPRATDFPVLKGTIAGAKGHLGAFELRVDDYAQPAPSSRQRLVFGQPRDGATSTCDLVLDLSGGPPLFPAPRAALRLPARRPARPGRGRAAAVRGRRTSSASSTSRASSPSREGLCAHSRSRITGCTRCLDLCPTGAITPAGDHVAIDPARLRRLRRLRGGLPDRAPPPTRFPPADALLRRLRTLLQAYATAGGANAGRALPRRRARRAPDRRPRPLRRRPAGQRPARARQRGHARSARRRSPPLFAYGAVGARFLARGRSRATTSRAFTAPPAPPTSILDALGYGADVVP